MLWKRKFNKIIGHYITKYVNSSKYYNLEYIINLKLMGINDDGLEALAASAVYIFISSSIDEPAVL